MFSRLFFSKAVKRIFSKIKRKRELDLKDQVHVFLLNLWIKTDTFIMTGNVCWRDLNGAR